MNTEWKLKFADAELEDRVAVIRKRHEISDLETAELLQALAARILAQAKKDRGLT